MSPWNPVGSTPLPHLGDLNTCESTRPRPSRWSDKLCGNLQPWDLHRKHLLFTIWAECIQTIAWGSPPPFKEWVFPQFRWLKPLGFSSGGYINPPIVLMVVGIPGYIQIRSNFHARFWKKNVTARVWIHSISFNYPWTLKHPPIPNRFWKPVPSKGFRGGGGTWYFKSSGAILQTSKQPQNSKHLTIGMI